MINNLRNLRSALFVLAIIIFANAKLFAQALPTLELDYLSVAPPMGPNTTPVVVPFSLDAINSNDYTTPTNPISYTVSLRNQVYTGLTYSNVSTGLTFGGGATLSSGGAVQAAAANVPYDLIGAYPNDGGPKSDMFTANPLATGAQLGTGFDVDGNNFSQNLNGGVQLFTASQVLFNNGTPKNARKYFGEVVFTFSRPVINPVMHFAGLGGSYSFLPAGAPSVDTNYQTTYYATELELVNTGLTSTKMSSNPIMTLTGNNILNNAAKPNGGSAIIVGETPLSNYGAATGSIRINGTFQELVYKVYLRGSDSSAIAWSAYGLNPVNNVPLVTGATRNPFTGDIWWAAASLRNPTQQISGSVFYDVDSLTDNNIATNGTTNQNTKVNPNNSLFANLLNGAGNVVAVVQVSSDGVYLFDSVAPGTYTVQLNLTPGVIGSPAPAVSMPVGWVTTGEKIGLTSGSDGLVNSVSAPITIVLDNITTDVNFGIRQPLSIGNLVWGDLNNNGIKDTSELGLLGATVYLYNDANGDNVPDGAAIRTLVTNASGLYAFDGLFDGKYIIGVSPAPPASGNVYKSSVIDEMNPNSNFDNNDNGVLTNAGITYSNHIILIATTEPIGELPNNATSSDSNANLTVDFGFFQPISISGTVFEDNNTPTNVDGTPLGTPSGVTLYANLVGANGNVVAVVPVNANGTYTFNEITSNATYNVVLSTIQGVVGSVAPVVNFPSGWVSVSEDCCDNIGNDGTPNSITSVTAGVNNVVNVNFGIRRPLYISNFVWTDLNSNGVNDEIASLGLNGVIVKLYSPGPNNVIGGGDDILISTVTTANNALGNPGYYSFDSLSAGLYFVSFPTTNATAPLTTQTSTAGVDNNSDANINSGNTVIINLINNDSTIDAAYLCVPPVANAGSPITLTCTNTTGTIGSPVIVGNTYSWSPATGLSSTTVAQPTTSATASTIYTVVVSSTIGCTAQSTVLVTVNTVAPIANAGVDKLLNCNTPSSIIGTTSIVGNTYSWTPSTALSATNVAQPISTAVANTTYVVTVTNTVNGCTAMDSVVVNVNKTNPIANAGTTANLTCLITSATIGTASVAGNTYSWAPNTNLSSTTAAQPTASPAVTTIYTLTVTNTTNGCTAQSTVAVNVNTTAPIANAGADILLNCITPSSIIGTIGLPNTSYSWNPTSALSASNIDQPISTALATTTYTLTATNTTNGCTATDVVVVTVDKTAPVANAGSALNLTCTNTSGTIGTAAIAGNTYSWSPNTNITSATNAQTVASPLVTTIYTLTVTNSVNGCTAQSTVAVNVNIAAPVANAGADITVNCTTPTAIIGATAVAGNTYLWTPSTALNAATLSAPITSAIATTTYTVTVTNTANGCSATDAVLVTVDKTNPIANAGPNVTLTCNTTFSTIGTASIAGLNYNWAPTTFLSATNVAQPTANPIATTIYTVTVTNPVSGCTATSAVTVTVNTTTPNANAGVNATLTCSIPSKVLGTAAVAGNSYSWSPTTSLSSATVAQPISSAIATTIYTLTVTNNITGCTATNAVVITVNKTLPTAAAGPDVILNCLTTSAQIGTPAVAGNIYSWATSSIPVYLTSATTAQPFANPTATAIYTVTVTTTANGCTAQSSVTVNVNTVVPPANAGTDLTLTCTNPSTILGAAAIAGNTYSWSPATGLNAANIAQPISTATSTTAYTLTVTDIVNGCTATDVVLITVNKTLPVANAGVDMFLTCTNPSASIGTPAIAGNTYAWLPTKNLSSTSSATPVASSTSTTTYTVTVTNTSNGCTSTDVVVVNVNKTPPVANAGSTLLLDCNTPAASVGTLGVMGNTYSWLPANVSSNSIAQPIASPIVNTIYTLTVTNTANGCTASSTVLVNVDITPPTVNITGGTIVCNGSTTPIIADGAISYVWSNGVTTDVNNAGVGTYTVTGTASNGCTATATYTVFNVEGSVGNYVWLDSNADGLFNEAPSAGINGVSLELWNSNTNTIYGTTTTQNDVTGNPGYFSFVVCNDGDYYVKFPVTIGSKLLTVQTATAQTDNNSDANASGVSPVFNMNLNSVGLLKNNTTIDAGYYELASISNYAWYDLNKNGIQDNIVDPNGAILGPELPVPGITLELYNNATNVLVASNVTGPTGLYEFPGLIPDFYYIKVVPNSLPLNAVVSIANFGPNDALDNDFEPLTLSTATIELKSGVNDVNWDLGIGINGIPSLTDPCICNEQVVYLVGDQVFGNDYIFNEVISIKATPGGVWRIIDLIPSTALTTFGVRQDPDLDGYPQLVNPTGSAFTETSLGNYSYSFSHREPDGYRIIATNGKDTLHISNACASIKEPTQIRIDSICAYGSPITLNTVFPNGTATYYKLFNSAFAFMPNFDESTLIASATPISVINPQDYAVNSTIALYIKWTPNPNFDTTYIDTTSCAKTLFMNIKMSPNFDSCGFGSIGDRVWNDLNEDGIQNMGEPGVANVAVSLYNNAGKIIGSTLTDAYGKYLFKFLMPNTYAVGFTLPVNYSYTSSTGMSEADTLNSDVNATTGRITNIMIDGLENQRSMDAGLIFKLPSNGQVGNMVWYDVNNNGTQDASEAGVSDVVVSLLDNLGNIVSTSLTDANGNYLFTEVLPGTYSIKFSSPMGTIFTANTGALSLPANNDAAPGTGLTSTFVIAAFDDIRYIDAGIILQATTKASIGNKVWNDVDIDGMQGATEPGVSGVIVNLFAANGATLIATTTTDAFGVYAFNNLDTGTYVVGFVLPANFDYTDALVMGSTIHNNSDANVTTGKTAPFFIKQGERNASIDAGLFQGGTTAILQIGDKVWIDINRNGIQEPAEQGAAGITVELYTNGPDDIAGSADDVKIDQTWTDLNGHYLFANLDASTGLSSNYNVLFKNLPEGYVFTAPNVGATGTNSQASQATGRTESINLTADNFNVDAGLIQGQFVGKASIGDKVFVDLNNNGIQNTGELGQSDVLVSLFKDANNNGIIDMAENVALATTSTDAYGNYLFSSLDFGTYQLSFSSLPTGFALSAKDAGADDKLDSDGNPMNTAVSGNAATPGKSYTGLISVASGEDNLSIDLGIVPPATTHTLGDFVWLDANNDGLQTIDEPGVKGVMVTLFDAAFTQLKVTMSDENGKYLFTGLADGSYRVGFSNLPEGYSLIAPAATNTTDGSDPSILNGVTNTVFLNAANSNDASLDAGLSSNRSGLGNYVWMDENKNGIQEGTEVGMSGVNVTLYRPTIGLDEIPGNADDALPVSATITNADGKYTFSNLVSGSYQVNFGTVPSGLTYTKQNMAGDNQDNTNSDANASTGLSSLIALTAGEFDLTVDAGLAPKTTATVGNYVWNDANRNNLQDATETGAPGVLVTLFNSSNAIVGYSVSDGNGRYNISNVEPGLGYYVKFTSNIPNFGTLGKPNWTTPNIGANGAGAGGATESNLDSDPAKIAGPTFGVTGTFDVADGSNIRNVDAGISNPITLTGNIWHDINGNTDNFVNNSGGLAIPQASPIPVGIRVYLVSTTGIILKVALAASNTGIFSFADIEPATNYFLVISKSPATIGSAVPPSSLPAGWESTGEKLGITQGNDGIVNGRLNILGSLNNIINANFGIRLKIGELTSP